MKKEGIVGTVQKLVAPVAEELGLALWDVEYHKEGADMVLSITIDKEEGVTIEDCEAMHRAIDPLLDEADPIEESYRLEVSSPEIERELRTPAHFAACVGWDVEVRLYAPVDGAKSFLGVLGESDESGNLKLTLPDGSEKVFPKAAVASVKTRYDFDEN